MRILVATRIVILHALLCILIADDITVLSRTHNSVMALLACRNYAHGRDIILTPAKQHLFTFHVMKIVFMGNFFLIITILFVSVFTFFTDSTNYNILKTVQTVHHKASQLMCDIRSHSTNVSCTWFLLYQTRRNTELIVDVHLFTQILW